jgi:hypothetical protein
MFCANTHSSPRDRMGTERAPSRRNSASPAASSSTLMDSNSIARTERNSLSFRQLVHPGCQNAFSVLADIGYPIGNALPSPDQVRGVNLGRASVTGSGGRQKDSKPVPAAQIAGGRGCCAASVLTSDIC